MHRSVIAKLENGERASVTLADLFVLSRALNVPPLALITPLTSTEPVEVLPGKLMTSWDALAWFNGDSNNVADAVTERDYEENNFGDWYAASDPYQMRWRYEVEQLLFWSTYRDAERASGVERELLRQSLNDRLEKLSALREAMSRLGVVGIPSLVQPKMPGADEGEEG